MASSSRKSFTATSQEAPGGGAYVELPFDVEATFGSKRPKVMATIDGEAYRGTAVRMGSECHLLLVLKAIRERIGKGPGDRVKVTVEPDTKPRVITPARDMAAALKASKAAVAFWKTLAYSHKREYAQWIEEAKRPETRERRIAKTIELLEAGVKSRR